MYREEKYAPLVADLSANFSVFNFSVEVSARGQITKENRSRIKALIWRCCQQPKGLVKPVTNYMSKAALLSSFSIFSRGHATLRLAVSVGRSVRQSVGPSVTFLNCDRFLHYCSC